MDDRTIFITGLVIISLLSGGCAWFMARLNQDNIARFEKVARWRSGGAVVAFLALLWCIPNARPIVWEWFQPWLFPTAVGCTLVAWWLLDYLFSRAIGGLAIISVYWVLHEAFTYHAVCLPCLTIVCWVLGVTGIFFSAKPHLLRDLMRRVAASVLWRRIVVGYLGLLAALTMFEAMLFLLQQR